MLLCRHGSACVRCSVVAFRRLLTLSTLSLPRCYLFTAAPIDQRHIAYTRCTLSAFARRPSCPGVFSKLVAMTGLNNQRMNIERLCELASVLAATETAGFIWHAQCGALVEKCKTAALAIRPQNPMLAEELTGLAANLDLLAYEPLVKSRRNSVETSIAARDL